MKLLVDLKPCRNLGDLSMLEAVVDRILDDRLDDRGADTQVFMMDLQGGDDSSPREIPTWLWDRPNIAIAPFKIRLDKPPWSQRIRRFVQPYWAERYDAYIQQLLRNSRPLVRHQADLRSLDDHCREFDALVAPGSGTLNDLFLRSTLVKCMLFHTFARQGKPVFISGQQIGPWTSGATPEALRRAVANVAFLGVREPTDSLDFCQRSGLPSDRYALAGDDSFGVDPASVDSVRRVLARFDVGPGAFLAANVRVGDYAASHGQQLGQVADLLRHLVRRYRMPILVVPISLNRDDSDIQSGHRLAALLPDLPIRVLDQPDLTPSLVKGILGRAFAAVGVSYHFCTFALSQAVPTVCIHHGTYYSQKARGLAAFWGDDRIAFPLGRPDHDGASSIEDLIEDEPARDRLRVRATQAVDHWRTTFDTHIAGPLARLTSRPPKAILNQP